MSGNAPGKDAAAEESAFQRAQAVAAAAAEAGRLAGRIEPRDGLAGGIQHAAAEVGLDAAQALAADDELADGDERQRLVVENALRLAGADAVAFPLPQVRDALQLFVLGAFRAARDLRVVPGQRRGQRLDVNGVIALQGIHLRHQPRQRAGDDDILAVRGELVHQPAVAEDEVTQEGQLLLVADRRIELRAGNRQLLQRDLAVEDLPGILPLGGAYLRHQVARVESRHQRRHEALSAPIDPQGGARGYQRQAVVGLARLPVMHAGGVVPHPVQVRDAAAGLADRVVQRAVGEAVRAVEDRLRRRAPVGVPVLTYPLQAAVDAARGDQDGLAEGLEGLAAFLVLPAAAADLAHQAGELLDAVAEMHRQLRRVRMAAQPLDELHRQFAAGAPDDMEARHRIARGVQAAFDPVRHRDERDAASLEPEIDVIVAAPGIGLGPAARPVVADAEFGEGAPVVIGLPGGIREARALLLAAADDEDAAEAFLRQAAEVVLAVAVEEGDAPAGVQQLQRRADARQAAADDDDVAFVGTHDGLLAGGCAARRIVVFRSRRRKHSASVGIRRHAKSLPRKVSCGGMKYASAGDDGFCGDFLRRRGAAAPSD